MSESQAQTANADVRVEEVAEDVRGHFGGVETNPDNSIDVTFTKDHVRTQVNQAMMDRGFAVSEIQRVDDPATDEYGMEELGAAHIIVTYRQVTDL
jgi:hypothetical protein